MDVFELRKRLISDYSTYIRSFISIKDDRINDKVQKELEGGLLWPDPLIQLNPSFEQAESTEELAQKGLLHDECSKIFRINKSKDSPIGNELRLHKHQSDAIKSAKTGANYVLTTGTGSGKSLAYIIPIVDHIVKNGSGKGIKAIIVYPMNALANSQYGELEKFISFGYSGRKPPVRFKRYTGQESEEQKTDIIENPPDILLTNYVMLELILTRPHESKLIDAAKGLRFFVLDELHTYRGRQGADVALLTRRMRNRLEATNLQCIGTSATLATGGTHDEQREDIAKVASLLFGSEVLPENIIGETLQRITTERDHSDSNFKNELAKRITEKIPFSTEYKTFIQDPLSSWLESTFGIQNDLDGNRLVRQTPRSIDGEKGAAKELSDLTGISESECSEIIIEGLIAGYKCEPGPDARFNPFAFRLHQFLSRGDSVYCSIDQITDRYITVHGQQFVPGNKEALLFQAVFCRECGQEYYSVWKKNDKSGELSFTARDFNDHDSDDTRDSGYIYISPEESPCEEDLLNYLPDDWLEEFKGDLRVKRSKKKYLPQKFHIKPCGNTGSDGIQSYFIPTSFQFCMNCGVSYQPQLGEFTKLSTLGSGGRSTATSILCLTTIYYLKQQKSLAEKARKLLSFTDNRQDASLQAGHFNDFIQTSLIRAALYGAVLKAGQNGITHEDLAHNVFDQLNLSAEMFRSDPNARFGREDDEKAFRQVLAYYLYNDLRKGWRVLAPNLEQLGLLKIEYKSLDELCKSEDIWGKCHPALSGCSPEKRMLILKVLLDYLRRELTIKVDFLDKSYQERIQQQSRQHLIEPWILEEDEKMAYSAIVYPGSRGGRKDEKNKYISPRSRFGTFLGKPGTFAHLTEKLSEAERQEIILQIFDALRDARILEQISEPKEEDDFPGYQIKASSLIWTAGDGTVSYHDPIRVPNKSSEGAKPNEFFVKFYKSIAIETKGLRAREHTAQVPSDVREEREERFRTGQLPILFCSPTMELGVDISQLNVVNMRNVPPTPANYAQRSGRAGRSGQPALVFTYCTVGSPHDQYYFKRPVSMVSGAVQAPRIDLTNEDLIRSHIQSIWLSETKLDLGKSLQRILDVTGENPTLALNETAKDAISNISAREKANKRGRKILESLKHNLAETDWYVDSWLDDILSGQIEQEFERCCDRWRNLHRAATAQIEEQHKIANDASKTSHERGTAKKLRREAETQREILTDEKKVFQSDFYSYRYFASEGFLPGYNFPRLPLSAYIPRKRVRQREDGEYVSRPRFLAISEFGPRAHIYHEGARYEISKVILPVVGDDELLTTKAKICSTCGYLHEVMGNSGPDLCEICDSEMANPLTKLFKMENVSTYRKFRISSDEEERLKIGYEIHTAIRFAERGSEISFKLAEIRSDDEIIGTIKYGQAAKIWRINMGWNRRKEKDIHGFMLDVDKGTWEKNESDESKNDGPTGSRITRVIPFVEDRKNCLLLSMVGVNDVAVMASLQAALKNAIQVCYQLEENELAAEPLPDVNNRNYLLIYEASEGGAGVLRHLAGDASALSRVAYEALRICHFNPDTGEDLRRADGTDEDCESACYNCLLSYSNQRDHVNLDRHLILDILMELKDTKTHVSPGGKTRSKHLDFLKRKCYSELEKKWLDFINDKECRLPDNGQVLIESCKTRPDFSYTGEYQVAIYIDGPPHDYPERQNRDAEQTETLENHGYIVVRFHHEDDWNSIIAKYPYIFGGSE